MDNHHATSAMAVNNIVIPAVSTIPAVSKSARRIAPTVPATPVCHWF